VKLNGPASETNFDYTSSPFGSVYYGGSYGGSYGDNSYSSEASSVYIAAVDMCDDCWVSVYVVPYYSACQFSIVATVKDVPIYLQGATNAANMRTYLFT
jgi:hypothetical protein